MTKQIRVFVERLPDRQILEGILHKELAEARIRVNDYVLSSHILGLAKGILHEQPDQPVAVVLNADATDPNELEENRNAMCRYLSRASYTGWHATYAIPRMDAWAIADDRIRAAFEKEPERLGPEHYFARAAEFTKLAQEKPFDLQALLNTNGDFRALYEFIQQHSSVAEPAAS